MREVFCHSFFEHLFLLLAVCFIIASHAHHHPITTGAARSRDPGLIV